MRINGQFFTDKEITDLKWQQRIEANKRWAARKMIKTSTKETSK